MRCVVTGVAGFIGSSLADKLLEEGHEVVGIDCFLDYYPRDIKEKNLKKALSYEGFRFVEGDIADPKLSSAFDGAEFIFHQAAQAGVRASWGKYFSTYVRNNVEATQGILEIARTSPALTELKRIIYASSSSVYGTAERLPTTEDSIPFPISPYGVTKLAGEHLMVLYEKEFDMPSICLRYFTVYGPRQRPDMGFYKFISRGLNGEDVEIYGDGEQTRDFTYIDDVVEANIVAAFGGDPTSRVFNVGGGSRVSINEVLKIIEELICKRLNVKYLAPQKGDVKHTASDTDRLQRELGFQPRVGLKEGLVKEIDWLDAELSNRI